MKREKQMLYYINNEVNNSGIDVTDYNYCGNYEDDNDYSNNNMIVILMMKMIKTKEIIILSKKIKNKTKL